MMRKIVRYMRRKFKSPGKSLQDRFPGFPIGVGSYGNISVKRFSDEDTLSIGKYCSFAQEVHILLGGNHRTDWVTTFPFSDLDPNFKHIKGHPQTRGPVIIENDVWVGYRATILSGVTISSGAIVAACSVVTKSVPAYAIVAGSPAKIIGYRFSEATRQALLNIAWWDWPPEKIKDAMPLLLSPNLEGFINRFGNKEGTQ